LCLVHGTHEAKKVQQKKVMKMNTMKTERDTLLQKITELEDKLMDA
jgi:hypothetical protein